MDMSLRAKVKFSEWAIQRYEFLYLRHRLDDKKLYKGDPRLLMFVAHSPGSSQAKIAKSLCIKPGTLTVMIKRMEAAGLVLRKPDDKDLRTLRVYITEEGKQIAGRTKEVFFTSVQEIYQGLSDQDLAEYLKTIEKIQKNLLELNGRLPKEAFAFDVFQFGGE